MKKIRNEEIDRNAEELFDGEEFDDDLLDDNATWKLTPKACLEIAINDTDNSLGREFLCFWVSSLFICLRAEM